MLVRSLKLAGYLEFAVRAGFFLLPTNGQGWCVSVRQVERTPSQQRSVADFFCAEVPSPVASIPLKSLQKEWVFFANLFWVIEQKEIWGVYDVSNMCFIFFSFLVFQEVFWRENWAVFCLAGVVYIVPYPIFCHWGDRVSLWVCNNWGRYSQVSPC